MNVSTQKITAEAAKLTTSPLLELFTIDATSLGMSAPLRYHNYNVGSVGTLSFQGVIFNPFPLEVKGYEFKTSGELPRPSLKLGNIAASVTTLCLLFNDLIGSKVTRQRTFARFLDHTLEPTPVMFWGRGLITDGVGQTQDYGEISDGLVPATALTPDSITGSGATRVCHFVVPSTVGTLYTISRTLDAVTTVVAEAQGNGGLLAIPVPTTTTNSSEAFTLQTTLWFGSIANFNDTVNVDADPYAEYPPDIYYIDRKLMENKQQVEFEMGISLDVEGITLPLRKVTGNTCLWLYRSAECGFSEHRAVGDINDEPLAMPMTTWRGEWNASTVYNAGDGVSVTTGLNQLVYVARPYNYSSFSGVATAPPNSSFWLADVCSKRIQGCQLRFDAAGQNAVLPFGAFPGTDNFS